MPNEKLETMANTERQICQKNYQFKKPRKYVRPMQSAGKRVQVIGFTADWFKRLVRGF